MFLSNNKILFNNEIIFLGDFASFFAVDSETDQFFYYAISNKNFNFDNVVKIFPAIADIYIHEDYFLVNYRTPFGDFEKQIIITEFKRPYLRKLAEQYGLLWE